MIHEQTGMKPLMRVGSIQVDGENYATMTSMGACDAQNKSIYYDPTIYMLYIHFDGYTIPWGHTVRLGLVLGFCDKPGLLNGAYYNDIYYDPRIISVPSLKKQKDNLFAGILQHTGGSVTFINSDGYFENLISDWNIFGQPIRIYAGFDGLSFSDFRQIFTGNVDDYKYDFESFTLNIVDMRKFLSRKIPINQFSTTTYPYITADNGGRVMPIAYGSIRNAPMICLNETAPAPSTYRFFLADTTYSSINSVSAVYIDKQALSTTKWSFIDDSVYISTGVSTTTVGGDDVYVCDQLSNMTADFISYSTMTLGLNVISDILYNYAQVSTNTAVNNYDSTEWTSALALSKQVGIYLEDETEITEVIKDICVAEDGIFLVMDDGRFTFRHESTTYGLDRTIESDEWLDEPAIEYKREEYLTSLKIKYDKNQTESDDFKSYTNFNYESTSFEKFKTYAQKEIKTVLTSTTDVYNKSESVMQRSKDIVPTITRKLKQQHIDLDIMDIIQAEHGRWSSTTKQWAKYRLIGIQKDLNNAQLSWTMRWLEDSTSKIDAYSYIVDVDGNYITDVDGNYLIGLN